MSDSINPYASPQVESQAQVAQLPGDVSPSALRPTGIGLALVFYGLVIVMVSMLLMGCLGPIAGIGGSIGGIPMLIGPLFCLTVPKQSGARWLIIGSVFFEFLMVAPAFFVLVFTESSAALVLTNMAGLFWLISFIFFVLFLRRVAQFLGDDDVARRAGHILTTIGVLFVLSIGASVLLVLLPDHGGTLAIAILSIILTVGMLALLIAYAIVVNSVRTLIRQAVSDPAVDQWGSP